jgi:hypothetical protein
VLGLWVVAVVSRFGRAFCFFCFALLWILVSVFGFLLLAFLASTYMVDFDVLEE